MGAVHSSSPLLKGLEEGADRNMEPRRDGGWGEGANMHGIKMDV